MPRHDAVDMSPVAVAARLQTVSALNRLTRHLGAFRPVAPAPAAPAPAAPAPAALDRRPDDA